MSGNFAILNSPRPPAAQTSSNATVQGAISGAISSAFSNLHLAGYAGSFILVVLLALFASIGYKLAKIGIEMIKAGDVGRTDSPGKK